MRNRICVHCKRQNSRLVTGLAFDRELLEELVSLQKAREADTVSVQALRIEKEEQSKVLEQVMKSTKT